jgi:hypothetical protein
VSNIESRLQKVFPVRPIQSFFIVVALTFTTISYSANAAEPSAVGQGNNSLTFAASTADSRSQYLDLSPGINFGSSAFTIETYFKTGPSLDNGFFLGVGSGNGLSLNIYSPNEIQVDAFGINATIFVLPITMQVNTWYHLAVARDASNNETVWLNGSRATSAYNRWDRGITYGSVFTDTRNYNGNTTGINGSTACSHCNQNHYNDARSNVDFSGVKITNFRVVVGSTVYDPNSATITPPDTPLANIANTKLLLKVTNSSTAFTDSSGTQTVTNTGVTFTTAELAAPAFTLSSSTETRTVNTAATGFTINSTGGAIASFAISATPPGMSFNTTTGSLTGTPNTVATATNYTITATNASGNATRTFTLTVTVAAPAFTLSSSSESKTVNTAITGYTITSTGGTIASYAISPAAPAGLTFNTTTGLLTGTPTEVAAATAYTITATNATSSTTQTFTLTVTAVPVTSTNSAAEAAAQAEAARRANEQREWGDLSGLVPLINELLKEMEEGMKNTSTPKKKSPTIQTKQNTSEIKKSEQKNGKVKNQAQAKKSKKK